MLRDPGARRRRDERRRGRDVPGVRAVAARARRCRRGRRGSGATATTCSRIASAQPAISSAVSPFSRSATRKPPICAWVASPAMIALITSRASSRVRSWPSSSRASASWITSPSRKFRASAGPSGVSTDSGWNCTPSTRSSRWRTAITSPSAAVADDLEAVGHRGRRERVVAAGLEALRQAGEDAACRRGSTAVAFPCTSSLRLPDLAAERRRRSPGGRGRRRAPAPRPARREHRRLRDAGVLGPAGPGRDHEVRGREPLDLLDRRSRRSAARAPPPRARRTGAPGCR